MTRGLIKVANFETLEKDTEKELKTLIFTSIVNEDHLIQLLM